MILKKQIRHISTSQLIIQAISASLGSLVFGFVLTVYNPLQENIHYVNNWPQDKLASYDGIITSIVAIGAIFGSFLSDKVCSFLKGKRNSFIILDVLGIIGSLITLISGMGPLLIGRFLLGLTAGFNSCLVPQYLNEISPIELIGSIGSITQLQINIGIIISFLMGMFVQSYKDQQYSDNYWRYMFGMPAVISGVRLIIFLFVYTQETPTYLYFQNKERECIKSLELIYKQEYVEQIFKEFKNVDTTEVSYKELFSKKYKNQLVVGIIMGFLVQQLSGINAVVFYSNKIFKGENPDSEAIQRAKILSLLLSITLTITAVLYGIFLDKYGRKSVLICCQSIMTFLLGGLSFCSYQNYNNITIIFIFLYCFMFGISVGPIIWIYLAEILPSKGLGLSILSCWLGTAAVGFIFPIMNDSIKIHGSFLVFMTFCLIGIIFIYINVHETKNKRPQEILERFNQTKDKELKIIQL